MNSSGTHNATNKSRARSVSAPVLRRSSTNSHTSACHGSKYAARLPLRRPAWLQYRAISL